MIQLMILEISKFKMDLGMYLYILRMLKIAKEQEVN
jgi:hypothetical protein